MNILKNKSLLVTGGTGSFGKAFLNYIIKKKIKLKRLVIFSRDEFKQDELRKKYDTKNYKFIRYFIGDIRDKDRLSFALEDIDFVIHAAAMKQVPTSEYNPFECIKTNVIGAQNLIETSLQKKVKKIIALSTDKAAAPINLYGASKLCSDKLFVAANNFAGKNNIIFSIVRYGNVMGSRGSVIPLFFKQKKNNEITITDKRMTRFNILLEDSIQMVLWSLQNSIGGEILVPKIPSVRIMDLAKAIAPNSRIKIIGTRPGEKIHEELITKSDSSNTYDIGKYYSIVSEDCIKKFKKKFPKAKKVASDFNYTSETNRQFLNKNEISKMLKHYEY